MINKIITKTSTALAIMITSAQLCLAEQLIAINHEGITFSCNTTKRIFEEGVLACKDNKIRKNLNKMLDDIRAVNKDIKQGKEPDIKINDNNQSFIYQRHLEIYAQRMGKAGKQVYEMLYDDKTSFRRLNNRETIHELQSLRR